MAQTKQFDVARDNNNLEAGGEPDVAEDSSRQRRIHPIFYIVLWITLSGSVILFNKWILFTAKFDFPLFLTTWHMLFATGATQLLAHCTKILDSRHKVPMTADVYKRTILPIGILFSFSLVFGNVAYIYLSVSFIQMLKATNVVVTLLITWYMGMTPPNMTKLSYAFVIVAGVMLASFGELKFHLLGFIFQVLAIVFEALRLVLIQRLLSSPELKMDPLTSLYYYAPVCAAINGVLMVIIEVPRMKLTDLSNLGAPVLLSNGLIAFLLNVAVVLLIGKTSAVVLTMSGVVKDILLVVVSMLMFKDPVTAQQFIGYSIALAGLTYYKLGAESVNEGFSGISTRLRGIERATMMKIAGAFMGLLILSWLMLPASLYGGSV